MFSFIRRLLQGTTFNFLKRCKKKHDWYIEKSILEPAVNSCLEAAALLLDSFSQLERAVILPQCLEEKRSILGFTWRDRRKERKSLATDHTLRPASVRMFSSSSDCFVT